MTNPAQVDLPTGYRPRDDEDYMSPRQLAYFRRRLLAWREELAAESRATVAALRASDREVGDDGDESTRIELQRLELRTRDRHRKLLEKIDDALVRIGDGRYGWCDLTGEAIGLRRLEARPVATLCLFAQELKEHRERTGRAGGGRRGRL